MPHAHHFVPLMASDLVHRARKIVLIVLIVAVGSMRHSSRLVLQTNQVIVFDDLLPQDKVDALLEYASKSSYQTVHARGVRKVWRLGDGSPLQGKTVYFHATSTYGQEETPVYPTGTVMDWFIERFLELLPRCERMVGEKGIDWRNITFGPWVYPVGTALSLHKDGTRYTGAYTYFLHPSWNIHWGGQLIVLDPRTGMRDKKRSNIPGLSWLSDEIENARVWDPGLGLCILPKPNRMVIISPRAHHLITRVDANAGQHPRISIAGFFMRVKATAPT